MWQTSFKNLPLTISIDQIEISIKLMPLFAWIFFFLISYIELQCSWLHGKFCSLRIYKKTTFYNLLFSKTYLFCHIMNNSELVLFRISIFSLIWMKRRIIYQFYLGVRSLATSILEELQHTHILNTHIHTHTHWLMYILCNISSDFEI